jgi:dTDP-4-dehydrorhamnose reductase
MQILLAGRDGQVGGALLPLLETFGSIAAPSQAEFDFSKPDTLLNVLDKLRPNLIVNAAAFTAVDRAEDERELCFLINAQSPGIIARWAAHHQIPLIHFSTDYVFDGTGNRPWREDSRTGPLSVYGASKLAGDVAILAAGGPCLIARTSWVYSHKGTNFLRTITKFAKERKELRVVADQFGAPTTARAIANAIVQILERAPLGLGALFAQHGGVVNVVCAGETTWHGFTEAIVRGLKSRGVELEVERVVPITTGEFAVKAKRPANSRLDTARLKEVFGVQMPLWADALDQELDLMIVGGH